MIAIVVKAILPILGIFALASGYQVGSSTEREPSIQAYGLPKHFLSNNGHIERIQVENVAKESNDKVDPNIGLTIRRRFETRIARPAVQRDMPEGTLEIVHLDSSPVGRNARSIGDDLTADETKVFRPLFVYRQQVARRAKLQRDREIPKKYRDARYRPDNTILPYYGVRKG